MNYSETVNYLFKQVPSFQKEGKAGYKEGLENTYTLDEHFHHPHQAFKTIHIAGTNGKGSTAHTLAAILQNAGYKVGLYTSPHLIDFRERIRINGLPISEQEVIAFVEQEKDFFEPLQPSFFELTTALAFKCFKEANVDYAIIETGLGGRLDCTNIIHPILSIITNISYDHMQFLGDTLPKIAAEKAGIIKESIPVIIGETTPEITPVFIQTANEKNAPLIFAEESQEILNYEHSPIKGGWIYKTRSYGIFHGELGGLCQEKNTNTILHAVSILREQGIAISDAHIHQGFENVCKITGLQGRWQTISTQPLTICDTGHNEGGFHYISKQITSQNCNHLHMVFGMVNDKDISAVLRQLPQKAKYYFTQAQIKRALAPEQLKSLAEAYNLKGDCFPNVETALSAARQNSNANDFIFIGGSSFIVADLLAYLNR